MDQLVRAVLWIALFVGTGTVVVMVLPRIVINCLEMVAYFHARKARRKALLSPHASRRAPAQARPQRSVAHAARELPHR